MTMLYDKAWGRSTIASTLSEQRSRAAAPTMPGSASSVLGEALARLPGVPKPIIQIISASASTSAMPVARALAASAARQYGRTLLVSYATSDGSELSVRGLSWLMSELKVADPEAEVPDGVVAGLYHLRLRGSERKTAKLAAWVSETDKFSMVVLSSPAIALDPRTLMLAAECDGSILSVAAGATRAGEVLAEARQLACAGIRVLGTVLDNAPSLFIRRTRV